LNGTAFELTLKASDSQSVDHPRGAPMRVDRCVIFSLLFTVVATIHVESQNRPTLSNVNGIGSRNINQGDVNFYAIEKEIALPSTYYSAECCCDA
jgi:hypothetical protein